MSYLLAGRHRDGQQVLVYLAIQVQNLAHLDIRLLLHRSVNRITTHTLRSMTHLRGKCRVALLPQELACAKERLRMLELPSYNVVPLVDLQAGRDTNHAKLVVLSP